MANPMVRRNMMDVETLQRWLGSVRGSLYPPGTICEIVEAKSYPYQQSHEVGVVLQHRFAFFFWARLFDTYKNTLMYSRDRPLLLSMDYHCDVGNTDTLEDQKEDLRRLNLSNEQELGLFCWLRLNPNNDAHILPALYLNFFSDAYVLFKQRDYDDMNSIVDREGGTHQIKYFNTKDKLVANLRIEQRPIYLDLDLDYFSNEGLSNKEGTAQLVPDEEIREMLSLKGALMTSVSQRLVGLTVALEPKYCGGLGNAIHVLKILDDAFFGGELMTCNCKWREY